MANYATCSPTFPAAGKPGNLDPEDTCANAMRDTSIQDRLMQLMNKSPEPQPRRYPDKPASKDLYEGYYTKLRELMNPGRPGVEGVSGGIATKRQATLPKGIEKQYTTFGIKSNLDPNNTVAALVNPKISLAELTLKEELGHRLYCKSHNSYFAGEQSSRNYNNPALSSQNTIWGKPTPNDPAGSAVRNVIQWFDQSGLSTTSVRKARHRFMHDSQIGKVFTPNCNIQCVPKGFSFGYKEPRDIYGVSELMSDATPTRETADFLERLKHVNKVRLGLSKAQPPFPYLDFIDYFKQTDTGTCGCVPLRVVQKGCHKFGISLDWDLLEPLIRKIGLLHEDGKVSYEAFGKLINPKSPLPRIGKVKEIPEEFLYYETTYQAQGKDLRHKARTDSLPSAGLTTDRSDKGSILKLDTTVDKSHLCGETTVQELLQPHMFLHYGLSHRDLLMPRSKEYIKELMQRISLDIPDDKFEIMWKEGLARDENHEDKVCVETFRNMLDEIISVRKAQLLD